MPKLATCTKSIRANRNRKALSGIDYKYILPAVRLVALIIFAIPVVGLAAAYAQSPLPSAQATGSTPSAASQEVTSPSAIDTVASALDDRSGMTSTPGLTAGSLSSDQIIDLLQRNPDLVVELKSLAADRMQEQGAQIDANDISDQMLYDQIATNANLRASITTFLRARGYVTDDDLQVARSNAYLGTGGGSSLMQPSRLSPGSPDAVGVAGAAGAVTRQSYVDASGLPSASATALMDAGADRSSLQAKRSNEPANASTDLPQVLRRTAPYNLRSMRDLYTQIPDRTTALKRFGSEVFVNRDASAERGVSGRGAPLDVPLGPDYVLGSGDTLQIDLWGGVTQSITRAIGRDGRILLPEAGSLQVAGLPLERAQSLIEGALKTQFRNAQVAVTVSRLRSIRVYVVGDVQRPGGYDISSLATPLSALYAAGGPTSVGSLRIARHMRGNTLIEETDLYDFLLHGVRYGSVRFESGDTLLVPPAGPQVAVSGAIKRPAIYELKAGQTTLANLVDDAGGFTVSASLGHITIERIDANKQRETVTLHLAGEGGSQADHDAFDKFAVKDGDRIRIEPILPYSERAIYLEGHVVRPGRAPFTDGMRLSDVLHSYRDLLPEPASQGEIVRLVPPDLHAETIDFNLSDVLIGNANVDLQPFDTIRIQGRYEVDAPKVIIRGEVLRPGSYPLSMGMTAAQLVRMAGGFKRDALLDSADLTSYGTTDGKRVVEELTTVHIGAAVSAVDSHEDITLKPGDILSIHQITGWNDIGESLTIEGQVRYPGSYGFKDGERLSSVLRRAGGLLSTAYPMGAVLVRNEVRELEQKSREELIRQIETNSASARLSPNLGSGDGAATLQLIKAQQDQVLADLRSHPPTGRMVIHISADIDSWANTPADIELRQGDVLTIPKKPGFVLVTGQVYNATAVTFAPDKTAGWYLSRAGGTNTTANRRETFIIRANGTVIGRHSVEWSSVLSTKLNPGDVVVVPQKIIGTSLFWKNLLTTAQLASSIAITAAVANI